MRYVVIDGKRYAWRDILNLRREQKKTQRKAQLALFELRDDSRPKSQITAHGRFEQPTLFKVD